MRVTKSFKKEDYNLNQKVYIYGAGRYGELAMHGLNALNVKIEAFIDGKLAGGTYCGYPVVMLEEMTNHTKDIVLVASYNYFYEMVSNLQAMGFEEIYDILELIKMDYDESVLSEYLLDEKHNWQKYSGVVEHADSDKLVITHCELVITECCSLKCRDCANLMQYYKNPENLDSDEMINSFNRFLDSIDILLELRVLGGEPFIRKDLDKILMSFVNNEKIKRITIYTNSTIVPEEKIVNVLKHEKICVHMSNYGDISRNAERLDNILTYNGVRHYMHNYEKWYDLGNIQCRNYSLEHLQGLYKSCMMAKCYTFYRGRLYLCPRAAHGERLGIFKNKIDEYVDFLNNVTMKQNREEIYTLLSSTKYLTACDYCNGSSSHSREIVAAIQLR